jgi:hypothetical protein
MFVILSNTHKINKLYVLLIMYFFQSLGIIQAGRNKLYLLDHVCCSYSDI